MSYDAVWWNMPWYVMLRYKMLWYAMICYNILWYAMICYDISARGKIQCTLAPPGSIRPPWGATALRNWAYPEDITKYEIENMKQYRTGLYNLLHTCIRDARKWRENQKVKREWRENKEMEREWGNGEWLWKWREIHSLHFLIFSFFPPSLSISCIKNCHILFRSVKYG